jgi:hypothetical protein
MCREFLSAAAIVSRFSSASENKAAAPGIIAPHRRAISRAIMLATPAAPLLETQRLILRGWRPEDLAPYAAMMADPETARFITRKGLPYSEGQTWGEMALLVGHWQLLGHGMFVVEERATGAFLGRVGRQAIPASRSPGASPRPPAAKAMRKRRRERRSTGRSRISRSIGSSRSSTRGTSPASASRSASANAAPASSSRPSTIPATSGR